tara:strand:- start:1459 stop:2121 length:663 start_codon:yes stop_codon:yes gene_type:complete
MSLLDEAKNNLSPYKLMMSEKAGKETERKFIIQPNILVDILRDEMARRVIDKKSKKDFKGFRTKLNVTEWTLKGMLNYVDEPLFREQIDKTIAGMLKTIKLRQPNGAWVVFDYEIDVRENKANDQAIMLAVKFVDSKNERDLKYQNGVPLVDVKVDVSGSNKELIEAIQAQNAASNGSDPEMKALLKQLAALMIQKESGTVEAKPEAPGEEVDMPTDFDG